MVSYLGVVFWRTSLQDLSPVGSKSKAPCSWGFRWTVAWTNASAVPAVGLGTQPLLINRFFFFGGGTAVFQHVPASQKYLRKKTTRKETHVDVIGWCPHFVGGSTILKEDTTLWVGVLNSLYDWQIEVNLTSNKQDKDVPWLVAQLKPFETAKT